VTDDYLEGRADADALKAVYLHVDEKRQSVLEKQKKIQEVLKKFPRFRAGILQLAVTWLQLGRQQEALQTLELHHQIDPTNCVVEYYLSILSLQRLDYNKAWQHLRQTEKILSSREHKCKALRGLRDHLRRLSPEPSI
jgi:tetratricopeptide (TPR) repeat protein